jgi:Fe-S-cluster-containing dehydrogenase component
MQLPTWQESSFNQRADELGLMQGQKLMLIDLDRCTRCDKCVEACVESHTKHWWTGWLPFTSNSGPMDGRSRLFLDGPRVQMVEGDRVKNYLVPSTCRQCKDAVCLFNCPVCSIHKGDNGQIVIEDWCIGCTQCANYCPYNSIQMHSVGVIPFSTFGWKYRMSDGVEIEDHTPFRVDPLFAAHLQTRDRLDFVYPFTLTSGQAKASRAFLLQVESAVVLKTPGATLTASIDGQTLKLQEKDKKNWEALLVLQGESAPLTLPDEEPPQKALRAGSNTLTISINLPRGTAAPKMGELLLDAGLIGYVPPKVDQAVIEKSESGEEFKQEWVMQLAAVCDMCSGQFGQQPACVNACPHEAAERRYVH